MNQIAPGTKALNRKTGEMRVWDGQQWVPQGGKPQPMEASIRARTDVGLAPMIQAQQQMAEVERGGNPFKVVGGNWETMNNAAAKALSGFAVHIPGTEPSHPFQGLAKVLGGEDFQTYEQAAKAFESQLMPIMSGAAVSASEAQRQIRAALPELGDSPQTLRSKAYTRAMMLNGIAKAKGLPLPFPEVPTWGVNTLQVPQASRSPLPSASGAPPSARGGNAPAGPMQPAGAPARRRFNPQTGRIE